MTNKQEPVLAWHFLRDDKHMRFNRAGEIVEAGKTYSFSSNKEIIPCKQGMHASIRALDALSHAPGALICRVEISGDVIADDDKIVGRHRKVLWMADASDVLRAFARWCALQVVDRWDAPEVVRNYLLTGDESLRDAAWSAARYVAWSAAWDAAWDAARDAAWDTAWDVARDAAWDTARSVERSEPNYRERDRQNTKLEEMIMALAPEGYSE